MKKSLIGMVLGIAALSSTGALAKAVEWGEGKPPQGPIYEVFLGDDGRLYKGYRNSDREISETGEKVYTSSSTEKLSQERNERRAAEEQKKMVSDMESEMRSLQAEITRLQQR
ncbi:hypothetical protein JK232_02975 [Nissabacter archeti]|uniref:DUF4124 domain-containing protein n=1 Tax=Nissabacter archeti TaxID=1917880 RepID=A0ABS5JDB2_9GAMM|nr:hypothetical protein [Nissabacter archeti]MBS0967849.1 hypothetical protein [Nissabacter archeti]